MSESYRKDGPDYLGQLATDESLVMLGEDPGKLPLARLAVAHLYSVQYITPDWVADHGKVTPFLSWPGLRPAVLPLISRPGWCRPDWPELSFTILQALALASHHLQFTLHNQCFPTHSNYQDMALNSC